AVMCSNQLTKRLFNIVIFSTWTALTILITPYSISAQSVKKEVETIKMSVQKRIPSDLDPGAYIIVNEIQEWVPQETAIITTDMWDKHWCTGATQRVAEMAPHLNEVFSVARDNGMLIVHAPSDCMDYYKDHPGRKLAQKYNSKKFE